MRIFLLTDHHAPFGGAELYFFELKRQLQAAGHEVFSAGLGLKAERGKDYYTFRKSVSPIKNIMSRLFVNPTLYKELRSELNFFQPDLIHLHNIRACLPSFLKAIAPYPTVQTVHDYGAVCPVGFNIHKDLKPCHSGFSFSCLLKHQVKHSAWLYPLLVYLYVKNKNLVQKKH